MKSPIISALALAVALGSTIVIAVRADAQQGGSARRMERMDRAPPTGLSAADRAAFLDARLAAIKAGLQLTPDQEKMWPAVEKAVRDGATRLRDLAARARDYQRPSDPIERLSRMAEAAKARGDSLAAIVEAARPLYASLGEDQKRRLPMLMGQMGRRLMDRGMMEDRMGMRMGRGDDRQGPGDWRDFRGPRGGDRPMDRGDRRGPPARDDDPERL
jgi:LTXXQ motif family protein